MLGVAEMASDRLMFHDYRTAWPSPSTRRQSPCRRGRVPSVYNAVQPHAPRPPRTVIARKQLYKGTDGERIRWREAACVWWDALKVAGPASRRLTGFPHHPRAARASSQQPLNRAALQMCLPVPQIKDSEIAAAVWVS